jgi:hypothetical protein
VNVAVLDRGAHIPRRHLADQVDEEGTNNLDG